MKSCCGKRGFLTDETRRWHPSRRMLRLQTMTGLGSTRSSEYFCQMTDVVRKAVIEERRSAVLGVNGCFHQEQTLAKIGAMTAARTLQTFVLRCLLTQKDYAAAARRSRHRSGIPIAVIHANRFGRSPFRPVAEFKIDMLVADTPDSHIRGCRCRCRSILSNWRPEICCIALSLPETII